MYLPSSAHSRASGNPVLSYGPTALGPRFRGDERLLQSVVPPHPEEAAEARAKAAVSKDGAAQGSRRVARVTLLTMRPGGRAWVGREDHREADAEDSGGDGSGHLRCGDHPLGWFCRGK